MQHWNIHITGSVQGVGYRAFVQQAAQRLQLNGFVRNQPDGSVYIEAEGEKLVLAALVELCFQGPTSSDVKSVDTSLGDLQHFQHFEITRENKE